MGQHTPVISPEPAIAGHLNEPASNLPDILKLSERQQYKNRLHGHTQRLGLPFPFYQTINEGFQHAPRFRSTVFVDGVSYTSTETFLHRKAAEQDASRVALEALTPKMKDEGYRLVCKDTLFCKSILHEYASKMNLPLPTYTTLHAGGALPTFVSNLVFNGATYTGELAKSKKEAEQLAARAAIQSIIDNSDSGTTMSEVIKCKFKLYAHPSEVTDSDKAHNGFMPAPVNPGASLGFLLGNGKEPESSGCPYSTPATALPKTCSDQPRNVPETFHSFHEFKKPKLIPSSEAITPAVAPSSEAITPTIAPSFEEFTRPIVFVPPVLDQSLAVGSTYAKKKNRKNKKAKRKNLA